MGEEQREERDKNFKWKTFLTIIRSVLFYSPWIAENLMLMEI
jgi:hypothetical protein